ncbi:hypothetical protein LIER_27876 [Lithospermum erythrorhizon]|uniref:Uncharacterized protein n=1 Tax=Lithospermum erythrorhizon TaxID=34254 RepID=A0AAV3RDK2_LITER
MTGDGPVMSPPPHAGAGGPKLLSDMISLSPLPLFLQTLQHKTKRCPFLRRQPIPLHRSLKPHHTLMHHPLIQLTLHPTLSRRIIIQTL